MPLLDQSGSAIDAPAPDSTEVEPNELPELIAKYEISEAGIAELAKRFSYHAPKDDQPERYYSLRADFGQLAYNVIALTPQSREQALALTYLEMAMMFANAAIARNE